MDIASAYDSPWLIAVNRVLLRLPVPRHSPCALSSLTYIAFPSLENLCFELFSLDEILYYYPISCITDFLSKTDSVIPLFSSHLAFFFFIQFSRYDAGCWILDSGF